MDSTHVYLDGNNLSKLGQEMFLGRSKVSSLYLNRSKITGLSRNTFVGLSGLKELHLDHNKLVSLGGGQFEDLPNLEVLYLNNNHLQFINVTSLNNLYMLRMLSLHNNMLATLQMEIPSQAVVTIHDNRWQCEAACQWVHIWHKLASDQQSLTCQDSHRHEHTLSSIMSSCSDLDALPVSAQASSSSLIIIIISVAVVILLLLLILGFLFITRNSLTAWVNSSKPEEDKYTSSRQYSAYLHYCLADSEYVHHHIVPRIPRDLCLHHHKDRHIPGATVGQAIAKAVSQSQCLIILASQAYFQSSIPSYELQMILAHWTLSYPIMVLVTDTTDTVESMRSHFRKVLGTPCDSWTFLHISHSGVWEEIVRVLDSTENIYHTMEDTMGDTTVRLVNKNSQETRI